MLRRSGMMGPEFVSGVNDTSYDNNHVEDTTDDDDDDM